MNAVDIIFSIIFIISLYKGYRNGLIVELCGILAIILGVFIANIFSLELSQHIDLPQEIGVILAFIAIFLATVISISIIARIISKILSLGGMGIINGILGSIAALIKVAIVVSLLYSSFQLLNDKNKWVDKEPLEESVFTPVLNGLSQKLFPHVEFLKNYFQELINDERNSYKSNGELV